MRGAMRIGRLAAAALLLTTGASGYYHFVHYLSSGTYTPVTEKFDLNSLPGRTVQFLIADQGPAGYASGDSFAAVVSQIRLAAKTWSDVPSSELRLAFGGLFTPGAQHSTPVIEVLFDEIPPGLVAYGGPTIRADASATGGAFVPILRSTVVLQRDLTNRPSWIEGFFLSVAHEFGHALGLQHSMTSSLMSTEVTRGTTKSKPLAADDIAAISLLYPTPGYFSAGGSISGRVAIGSDGLNLASVVALSPEGAAVSGMTNPDGTYRIDGLAPGSYYVYAHPLPPPIASETFPANITPPLGPGGNYLPSTASFETVFYPGVRDTALASFVVVSAGEVAGGIDFSVRRRAAPAVYAVQTYSFPGQIAVKPAHLVTGGTRNFVLATGFGLTAQTGISVVGGTALIPEGGIKPYTVDPRFVQMDFQLNLISSFSGEGPRHLTFSADNDLYVLPSAFRLVRRAPPEILSVNPGFDAEGNRQAVITGTSLQASTVVLFDGVPATVKLFDEASGTMVVTPPPAPAGHRAKVVALSPDGQSSLFLQASNLPVYEYDAAYQPGVTLAPSQLPAGAEAMVEVLGEGTGFAPGMILAFGTGDVFVRRVWVLGPNRILANIAVSPQAQPSPLPFTLVNGLRMHTTPFALQIGFADGKPQVRGPVRAAVSGRTDVAAGALAAVPLAAGAESATVQVSVNDRPATVQSFQGGELQFRVPLELSPGPAVVRILVGGVAAPPVVMHVDLPPPEIAAITAAGAKIDATRPARSGELLSVVVKGLGEPGAEITLSRVKVLVGLLAQQVLMVTRQGDSHVVHFNLDPGSGASPLPLVISVDGRESAPFALPVRAN